jgi:elongation factor Tu
MEGAILVVAVNDGPQVQTREHVILAKEVGIPYIIVYINKIDLRVSGDMKELVELEVRELLEAYGFPENLPVVKGSAKIALEEDEASDIGLNSVAKLMDYVDSYIKLPERNLKAPFVLSVESTLVVRGRGTVVTGKVEQGSLHINDELDLVGEDIKKTIVMGLEMFKKSLEYAEEGDNVGVLIKNIKKKEVTRGNLLVAPGYIKPVSIFKIKCYFLTKQEGGRSSGFAQNYKPQFFFRTSNITGNLIFPEDVSFVMPGDSLELKIQLYKKSPLSLGLKVIMREGNLTIGAGVITELIS